MQSPIARRSFFGTVTAVVALIASPSKWAVAGRRLPAGSYYAMQYDIHMGGTVIALAKDYGQPPTGMWLLRDGAVQPEDFETKLVGEPYERIDARYGVLAVHRNLQFDNHILLMIAEGRLTPLPIPKKS